MTQISTPKENENSKNSNKQQKTMSTSQQVLPKTSLIPNEASMIRSSIKKTTFAPRKSGIGMLKQNELGSQSDLPNIPYVKKEKSGTYLGAENPPHSPHHSKEHRASHM